MQLKESDIKSIIQSGEGYNAEFKVRVPAKVKELTEEVWEIPETALKESIINALSHRDYYDKGGRTMIELFDDRVEITNPGGLVSAISQEEFGTKSSSRNPLVFGLFQRMDMVEQVGSGIRRIKKDIREAGLPEPVFKTKGMFTIVFERPIEKTVE